MSSKYLLYGIITAVILIIVWIVGDTVTQPGVGDLKGDFIEMASYRNENNTGPVIRIYAVYTSDSTRNTMLDYGNFMPHTKYGNTKVFFFNDKEFTPKSIRPSEPIFESKYEKNCIAVFEKTAMGDVRFKKYPFQ